jgi:hypothetical protein
VPLSNTFKNAQKIRKGWAALFRRSFGKAVFLVLICILVAGAGAFFFVRSHLPARFIKEQLVTNLQKYFGDKAKIDIGKIKMDGDSAGVSAEVKNVTVRGVAGNVLLSAPDARIEFDSSDLARFDVTPKSITLKDTQIAIIIDREGQVSLTQQVSLAQQVSPVQNEPKQVMPSIQDSLAQVFAALKGQGADAQLQFPSIKLDNGRVEIEDQRTNLRHVFANININVEPFIDGKSNASFSAKGANGIIVARLMSGSEPLSFQLVVERVTMADIEALIGAEIKAFSRDLPLSFDITSSWSEDAQLKRAAGKMTAGKGQIFIDDPDAKPIDFARGHFQFDYLAEQRKIAISDFGFDAGGVAMQFAGEILQPVAPDVNWAVSLSLQNGILAPLTANDKPIDVLKTNVSALVDFKARVLKLQSFDIATAQLAALLSGFLNFDTAGRMGLTADLSIMQSDARHVLHIWPAFVAPDLRKFLVANLSGGKVAEAHVATTITADTFDNIKQRKPMPVESVAADFALSDGRVTLVPGVPPISALSLKARANGRVASVSGIKGEVKLASGKVLLVSEATVSMPDLAQHPIEARSQFRLNGPLEGVSELLAYPALKGVVPVSEKGNSIKGIFDGLVTVTLPLKDKILPNDVVLQVKATLQSFVAERFLGKESFEAKTLQFLAQAGVMSLKGEGNVAGMLAKIDLVQPRSGNAEDGAVTFILDEAARAKRGLNLSPQLTGVVSVLVKADFPVDIKDGLPIEVDLTKANIDGLLPNWVKAAGKPAKLRFVLNEREGGYRLNNLELQGNAPTLKGSADIGADGSLISFALSSLVLSQGDVMQVEGQKTAIGMKIVARANSFDARPFLRGAPKNSSSSNKDVEIDLKAVALSGFNGEVAANTELKLVKRGAQIKQGSFNTKLNGVAVNAKITPRADGAATIIMTTQNAGAVLRFMDIYNRMQGGEMDLHLTKTGASEAGYLIVHDFTLRDEPAFKRASAAASDNYEQGAKRGFIADASDVAFTKLKLDFTRKGDFFDVSDAVMWGNEVGGTLSGQLDYGRDYVNIIGTFVPAYGLNNLFAKIPVLGLFLTGNKYEGVFSVPFQITGRASKPTLSINAIAAVSPGFLRKIFEFRGGKGVESE